MRAALLLPLLAAAAWAQNVEDVVKRGEQLFTTTCGSGYCHGGRGVGGGAPRLAARGFDQAFIATTVRGGVAGTNMAAFGGNLPGADLAAIVAYVARLNNVQNIAVGGGRGGAPAAPKLSAEAARGQALFTDAVRGFGRCSTCHEVGGFGIPVAAPIHDVPASAAALKALATPRVATATIGGQAMPALIVASKSTGVTLYDLTVVPPVLRSEELGAVQTREGSAWRHSTVIGRYSDAELGTVLAYLRTVVQ
jgi:mono/diheme cytochrome c family protein